MTTLKPSFKIIPVALALCGTLALADSAIGPHPELPPPSPESSSSNFPHVLGWPKGKMPQAPAGFKVNLFVGDLPSPRKMYLLPNGDVLVSEATGQQTKKNPLGEQSVLKQARMTGESANQIELFRGLKGDGTYKTKSVFLANLNQPFGMLLLHNFFYVANTDSLYRYPYKNGDLRLENGKGEKILDFPTSGYHGHWTRNLIANPEGTKILVAVGSSTNVGDDGVEAELRRANILEIDPDGSHEKIFANGLRNPIGINFYPKTQTLWAVVNERDKLGDDLVPDYMTHIERDAFYGWPYSYYGSHEDPRRKGERPDLVKKATVPDFALGNHTASLSLNFYEGKLFPAEYQNGVFIGQHGSWNSSIMRGYDVYFIPFKDEKPVGLGKPFLTGFIADEKTYEVYGRPVDTLTLNDGSLLVTDDGGGKIWRVSR